MIALAVVAAQYAGTFDASISARGDARGNAPATIISVENRQEQIAIAADASFAATAVLHLHDRFWDFLLAYSPSMVVPDLELQVDRDVNPAVTPTFLNGGSAGIRWHNRHSWFSLTESGAYGTISTAVPYTGAPTTPTTQQGSMGTTTGMTSPPGMITTGNQPVTQTTLFSQAYVQYAASNTGLSVGTMIGRRTTASLSANYSLSGGVGDDTFTTIVPYYAVPSGTLTTRSTGTPVVPYQAGPTAALSIATRISPSEVIATTLSGNDTYTNGETPLILFPLAVQNAALAQAKLECTEAMVVGVDCTKAQPVGTLPRSNRTDTVQLEEGYRRRLSTAGMISVGAGVAGIYGPVDNGGYSIAIVPVFEASYIQNLYTYWPGLLTVTLSITPTVDLLTSTTNDQATVVAMLGARVTKKTTVTFTLTASQTLAVSANDSPLTGIGAGVEAKFRLDRQADVIVGTQEYWQDQVYAVGAGLPDQSFTSFTALAYVGVTLRAPTLHF